MAIFREGYKKAPDPAAEAERKERFVERWVGRFRACAPENREAFRPLLRELASEVGSRADETVRRELGPLTAERGFPYNAETSYGNVAALERLSCRDARTGGQVACADLFFETSRRRVILMTDLPSRSPEAVRYGQALAEAFRGMFGARAWPDWTGGSGAVTPGIESVHLFLEKPDATEAGPLLSALREAVRLGDERGIREKLDAVCLALLARTPRKPTEFNGSDSSTDASFWIGSFGSGTSGQRLILNVKEGRLSFPADSYGLSWTYQDGMSRLFGDRAAFNQPKSPTRSISVKIS